VGEGGAVLLPVAAVEILEAHLAEGAGIERGT
jgi:hypothetical protein